MFSVNTIIPVVFHVIFLVTGSTGSLFILAVELLDWLKTHQLVPVDLIIVSIGFVNLLLQGSITFNEICMFLFVEFYAQVWIVNSLIVIMTALAFSSLCCSTILCFYYYVKLINLNGTLFYKLKAKLPVVIPWLLVFSNIISWTAGLPAYWDLYIQSAFPTDNATHLPTTYHLNFKSRCHCIFEIFIAFSVVPFTIILFTAGAFIRSLYKHMTQIKRNNAGIRHAKLSAHISAARTETSLLILYLIFYGTLNIIFTETQDAGSLISIITFIIASSLPTANAVILILGNRKLSSKLRYVFGVKLISGDTHVSFTT